MKILVFGASGSGTTTLSNSIANLNTFVHLDIDDYYWRKTTHPFQEKVPLKERNQNLKIDFNQYDNVIVSGSLVSWGEEWKSAFDICIFITLNNELRMKRLREREIKRYGKHLTLDKKIRENSKAFLKWANNYENQNFNGRSLKIHEEWIKQIESKIIRVNGAESLANKTEKIINVINSI